jgi:hypothetical protein
MNHLHHCRSFSLSSPYVWELYSVGFLVNSVIGFFVKCYCRIIVRVHCPISCGQGRSIRPTPAVRASAFFPHALAPRSNSWRKYCETASSSTHTRLQRRIFPFLSPKLSYSTPQQPAPHALARIARVGLTGILFVTILLLCQVYPVLLRDNEMHTHLVRFVSIRFSLLPVRCRAISQEYAHICDNVRQHHHIYRHFDHNLGLYTKLLSSVLK